MNITKEMWDKMQKDMTDLKKKVSEIPELQLKVLKLTGKVNTMDARIYGRARSERLSVPHAKQLRNNSHYRSKVDQWHNRMHAKHFTDEQIKKMKQSVGTTYEKRKQTPRDKRTGVNNYGSMGTDSLKAVGYALGRASNKASSHGGSSIKSRTPTSQRSVTSKRR